MRIERSYGRDMADKNVRYVILPVLLTLVVSWSFPACATEGDVFARGVKYNTVTYSPHPSKCGTPLDINIQGTSGSGDEGTPLFAPEDGKIEAIESTTAWGNYIYWTSDSGEKLFLAHLKQIDRTGRVYGGEKIGELGRTGGPWGEWGWNAHLHIERCGGKLALSGEKLTASKIYTSKGQIKKFFYVWEPARRFSNEEDYGIGWWPSDVPCVEAKEWTEDKKSILNTDNSICREAFNILAERSWYWDGTYDYWDKVFFEYFDPQCKAN